MAVNAGFTVKTDASDITVANGLKKWTTVVDVTALTGGKLVSGDWVKLFYMPAGTKFVSGTFEVLTVDAGGGALHVDSATSSTHVYHSSSSLAAKIFEKMDHSDLVVANQSAAYVYMYAASADVTTAKVRVTMLTMDNSGDASSL